MLKLFKLLVCRTNLGEIITNLALLSPLSGHGSRVRSNAILTVID